MKFKIKLRSTLRKFQEVYKQYVEKCKTNANIDREELVTLLEPRTAVIEIDSEIIKSISKFNFSISKIFWLLNFRCLHCLANKRASFAVHRIIW